MPAAAPAARPLPPPRRPFPLRHVAAALAGALAVAVAACTWSVPADPGLNARLRSRPRPVEAAFAPSEGEVASDDGETRGLFLSRCGRCHEPPSPRAASREEWRGILAKMGPRAGVFGEERERVLRWLEAGAR